MAPGENDAAQLKHHIPKFAPKGQHDDHVYAATWRGMNINNLWEAFLEALRTVKNDGGPSVETGNEPWVDEANGKACCKYHLRQLPREEPQHGEEKQQEKASI